MTAETHTPEPWYLDHQDNLEWCKVYGPAEADATSTICVVSDIDTSDEEGKANARRIISCVNALAGLDPSAIGDLERVCKTFAARVCEDQSKGYERTDCSIRTEPPQYCPVCTARAALARLRGEPSNGTE